MAQQLHYTSAATGLSGRPGFQFVAASPGATVATQQAVAPRLSYRPPPSAPPQPSPAQLAEFPVSYGYVRDGDTAILTRCCYLGTDYSGRYGNFLGHALVAPVDELGEAPPIGLWGSPVWAEAPAAGPDLPELPAVAALPAGTGVDRASLADWLAGPEAAGLAGFRLAELVDAVLATLEGRAGQVFLVAPTVVTVARAIAVASYSLPPVAAQRLSFVTYTGDVARAGQHVVGTVTDAWTRLPGYGQVFRLDQPATTVAQPPGRYAAAVDAAWRDRDMDRLDLLIDLVTAVAGDPDGLAGLAEREAVVGLAGLCRGDRLGPDQPAEVAGLLDRHAEQLPGWVWDDLTAVAGSAAAGGGLGLELALAMHRAAGRTGRTDLADRSGAAVVGLVLGRPADRHRLSQVHVSADAAAGLSGQVGDAVAGATGLTDLTDLAASARRLGVPLAADRLRAGTARAVAAGHGRIRDLLQAVAGIGLPAPPAGAPAGDRSRAAELQAAVLDGVVDGLGHAEPAVAAELLADDVCALLRERDWSAAPAVGARVLAYRGRRFPPERLAATQSLIGLGERGLLLDFEVGRCLREIWQGEHPDPFACQRLLARAHHPQRARQWGLLELARQAMAGADVTGPDMADLAEALYRLLGDDPQEPVLADAAVVRAVRRVLAGDVSAYRELSDAGRQADPKVLAAAMAAAADRVPAAFARATPQVQADALLALDPSSKQYGRLIEGVLDRLVGDDERSRLDFAHLTVLLWQSDAPNRSLIRRLAKLAESPRSHTKLQEGLQRRQPSQDLRRAYERILDDYRNRGVRGLWSELLGRG